LGHCTPANVFNERGFFLVRRCSLFGIQHPQRLNGLEIPLKLLLRSALAKTVGFGDAVVAEVLRRFFLMATVAVS